MFGSLNVELSEEHTGQQVNHYSIVGIAQLYAGGLCRMGCESHPSVRVLVPLSVMTRSLFMD